MLTADPALGVDLLIRTAVADLAWQLNPMPGLGSPPFPIRLRR